MLVHYILAILIYFKSASIKQDIIMKLQNLSDSDGNLRVQEANITGKLEHDIVMIHCII